MSPAWHFSDHSIRHLRKVTVALIALALLIPAMAHGQALMGGTKGDIPMEVFADDGIEWQQNGEMFIARGNAKAERGEFSVRADELRAFYREKADGSGTEIWRLEATGNVRMASAQQTAYGDTAAYDVIQGILVLSGNGVRLEAGADHITAKRQLEYWEAKQMAVARGDAVATRQGKQLAADVIAAYLRPDKQGKSSVYRIDAFNGVEIKTDKDTVLADKGVYNVESGIATLTGSVKINRGPNQLNGCSAEVNLNTGVSTLKSCGPVGDGRVRGVLSPNSGK